MSRRTLSELADLCGASVEGDGSRSVSGLAPLREATASDLSLYNNPRYRPWLETTAAVAVLAPRDLPVPREDLVVLRSDDANRAFSAIVACFAVSPPAPVAGVHSSAVIDPEARLGRDVSIGAGCVVQAGAELGEGVVLHPRVVVGPGVRIGAGSELHPGVTLYHGVELGERCVIHAGTVLGADGFGFDPLPPGPDGTVGGWTKVPQVGTVRVGNDVEIGANSCIDRGRFAATRIGNGVKIDNLVHVAHNVVVEDHVLLIAQCGLSGSSRIGRGAIVAGNAGVAAHVTVGAGAVLGPCTAAYEDLAPGSQSLGFWAMPKNDFMRMDRRLRQLDDLFRRVAKLERDPARAGEREPGGDS